MSDANKYDELSSKVVCAICTEDYTADNLPTGISCCEHIYHSPCIRRSFNECSNKCPLCTKVFDINTLKTRQDIWAQLCKFKGNTSNDNMINVFLKDLSGNNRPMQVKRSASVAEFAEIAGNLLGVPKDKLAFTAEGRMFSYDTCPNKKLSDFKVQDNSSIFSTKRSHGGEKESQNTC